MLPLLVVHDFNVADQIADDFYTIEICSRDLRGGEVIFDSRYLFTQYEVTNCHDAPPIHWNALACDQAIRPAVWRCFKKLDSVAITPLFAYYVSEFKSDRP
jgi:hypothetical protein